MARPLGRDQRGVLSVLANERSHGRWYGGGWGCGWHWNGTASTERILDSLVRRGLVSKALEPVLVHGRTAMVWRLTDAGREALAALKGGGR